MLSGFRGLSAMCSDRRTITSPASEDPSSKSHIRKQLQPLPSRRLNQRCSPAEGRRENTKRASAGQSRAYLLAAPFSGPILLAQSASSTKNYNTARTQNSADEYEPKDTNFSPS